MSSAHKGMIFLSHENEIVKKALVDRFSQIAELAELGKDPAEPGALAPFRSSLADFDGVSWLLESGTAAIPATCISVSLIIPCWADLLTAGAIEALEEEFGKDSLCPDTVPGYSFTMMFDFMSPPWEPEVLVAKVTRTRRTVLGAPFTTYFNALAAGATAGLDAVKIDFRLRESFFVIPRPDRVVVVFSIDFDDVTDRAMARVIATEFAEASRTNTEGAPPVQFRPPTEPPAELEGVDVPVLPTSVGFISFGVQAQHINTPHKLKNTVDLLSMFRNYIHYHIKAAKSYLQMRMRLRVDAMLDVLNQAIPKDPTKEKTTASGKRFARK